MLQEIQKTADKLRADGLAPGDRVAIISEPCSQFMVITLACWKIGAVIAPISTRYPKEKIDSAIETINCKKVFAGDELSLSTPRTTPITLYRLDLDLDPNADASIIFTSGSSGEPKGVLHTIANHYYNALGSHENIPFGDGDAWLASLPMYHVSGFSLIMRALIAGGTIVFPQPEESLADAIMHPAVTHLSLVPTQLKRLLEKPPCVDRLRKLNAILVGGSAIPPGLIERAIHSGLPVCTTYGSTEAASQIATGKPGIEADVKVLSHRKVKIAPDNEILVKGETIFKGYVHGDSVEPAVDSQVFFHTGDTGSLDDDGNLHVTGRKDLMFICGGENIHPEEIERALNDIDQIEQAVVIPVDDDEFGKRPAAFIKTKDNLPLDSEKTKTTLQKTLEPFKIPKTFHPWPESIPSFVKPARESLIRIAKRQS